METQSGRAKKAVLCWGTLASRVLAEQWYTRVEFQFLEDLRGPAKVVFAEGDLRAELRRQFGHYIRCACRCRDIREDLWDRLGTAILARHSSQLPSATRFRLDLKTLREWVCRPEADYSDWDKTACRRT